MKTLDVTRKQPRVQPADAGTTVRRILLACGILASLLYAAMLVFVPMRWEGFSIGVWLLWVVVLAIALLQSGGNRGTRGTGVDGAEPDQHRMVAGRVA